jgi:predicted transcriptional regulator
LWLRIRRRLPCFPLAAGSKLKVRTVGSTKLTASAELVLDPKSYQSLGSEGSEGQIEVVRVVAGRSWVENVAAAIEKLVLAGVSSLSTKYLCHTRRRVS